MDGAGKELSNSRMGVGRLNRAREMISLDKGQRREPKRTIDDCKEVGFGSVPDTVKIPRWMARTSHSRSPHEGLTFNLS